VRGDPCIDCNRIAAGLAKRVAQRIKAQWDSQAATASQPAPTPVTPLPEAPASVNVYVTLAGRQVQVTLRDSDEGRLLARLETLLQRFPAEDAGEQESAEGWCTKHSVQMKLNHGKDGSTGSATRRQMAGAKASSYPPGRACGLCPTSEMEYVISMRKYGRYWAVYVRRESGM
jgi:hypothetical protein